MIVETEYSYELETELSDLNENNFLKPYGYQKLFVKLGDMHLNNIGINVNTTIKKGLAWAFTSMSIDIVRPIEGIVKLFGRTWHSQQKGPLFRREYLITDEVGNIVLKGCSFSVLLDIENRSIYRKREIPFFISDATEEFVIEAKSNKKVDLDFLKLHELVAKNSHIDCLGHVNNCRYGEFAYDVFTDDEIINLNSIKRMDVYFRSELRKEDRFSMLKAYDKSGLHIRGENNTKKDISFDMTFIFG